MRDQQTANKIRTGVYAEYARDRNLTLEEIKKNDSIRALVKAGNPYLETLGYTDHGPRHLSYVSCIASYTLKSLGYSEREIE